MALAPLNPNSLFQSFQPQLKAFAAPNTPPAPAPAPALPQGGGFLNAQVPATVGLPQAPLAASQTAQAAAEPALDSAALKPLMEMFSNPRTGVLALFFCLLAASAQGKKGAEAPTSAPNSAPTSEPEGGSAPTSAPSSAPSSTPTSAPTSSSPGGKPKVYILGSQWASAGTVRDLAQNAVTDISALPNAYGATQQTPAATAAFQKLLAEGNAEVLNTPVPTGQSVLISDQGKVVGFVPTAEVTGNASLGVQRHVTNPNVNTNIGGSVKDSNGQEHEVIATGLVSPIALDLNNDGQIGTTGVSTAKDRKALAGDQVGKTVSFDIDADGKQDNIEWLHGEGDGMLVDDADGGATQAMNSDGKIDGSRLFGDQGGKFANGYQKLARHDKNGDGKLTGQELEGLKVWTDKGSDARVGKGELKSLKDLGITELDVNMKLEKNTRGEDLMRSSFVQNGQKKMTEDVWFAKK